MADPVAFWELQDKDLKEWRDSPAGRLFQVALDQKLEEARRLALVELRQGHFHQAALAEGASAGLATVVAMLNPPERIMATQEDEDPLATDPRRRWSTKR